ncbi:MAG: hypothetical protein O3A63_10005 [Proteobacteria bacterium]|nr:hypothetical protein [Pseudomonadota bacterium]
MINQAAICSVRVAAAHEGVAELVVTLAHSNGGRSVVALDHLAASALLSACAANTPEQLIGESWSKVRDALGVSFNRFSDQQSDPETRQHNLNPE